MTLNYTSGYPRWDGATASLVYNSAWGKWAVYIWGAAGMLNVPTAQYGKTESTRCYPAAGTYTLMDSTGDGTPPTIVVS